MHDQPPPTRSVPKAAVPKVGEVVMERYRVERMVGTGGMAHVLAARHVGLGTEVAIKVLDPTLLNDFDAMERFSREARAMASLSSKHTVRVYDVGHLASGLPFMVMELLIGRDLGQELKARGSLDIAEACECIDQACQAVAEAHAAGIIHRDLKPQNLFLTRVKDQPMVRVLDFGIARATGAAKLETITRLGDMIGTLHYMSPEQIRDSKGVDPRSDVWSLGACLYKLITGYPPFPQAGEAPLMSAILTLPPKPIGDYRGDVPAVVSSIVMRCLKKPLEERFQSVTELRKALVEARNHMVTDDYELKTELMPKLRSGSHPGHVETMQSATGGELSSAEKRAKLTATMPLDSPGAAEARAAIAAAQANQMRASQPSLPPDLGSRPSVPSRASYPGLPPAQSSQPHLSSQQPTRIKRAPVQSANTGTGGSALSFVMIIVAVAIGVFVAGLGLLFVLSRHR